MSPERKFVILLTGILLLSLFACQTPTPTPPPTFSPTSTPSPTAIPAPQVTFLEENTAGGGQWRVKTFDLQPHIIELDITCDPQTGCLRLPQAEANTRYSASLTVQVGDQIIWHYACSDVRPCEKIHPPLQIAFRAETADEYPVYLYGEWLGAQISAQGLQIPSLLRGIAYSPFRDCQSPHLDIYPNEEQIREDLKMLEGMGNAIRTYSSVGIVGQIPQMAQKQGFRVSAGAWLGKDLQENEQEIAALIQIANTGPLESVIVGNEVLLRGDLTEEQLIGYIERVKQAVNVPVTSAEVAYTLAEHPQLMQTLDYYLIHIYAYWDRQPAEGAAAYVAQVYRDFEAKAGGKRVIIGETGWPSNGPINERAVPSLQNQQKFLQEFIAIAEAEEIEYYYFSVFDEMWKSEGGVGPFWGYVYAARSFKYPVQSLLLPQQTSPASQPVSVQPAATSAAPLYQPEPFVVYRDFAAEVNHFSPSGWMGDIDRLNVNSCSPAPAPPKSGWGADLEEWPDRAMTITYSPEFTDKNGWAGIYWLHPENNWGNLPDGFDLTGYSMLTFKAKSTCNPSYSRGSACNPYAPMLVKFFVGGVVAGAEYPSSITQPIYPQEADRLGFVTLTPEWQEFHIDLVRANKTHVFDGFGLAFDRIDIPFGASIDLDDIQFVEEAPPFYQPQPTTIPESLPIFTSPYLSRGFEMGVDTNLKERTWATFNPKDGGLLKMQYPGGQAWGVVFITYGDPEQEWGQRQGTDLSAYTSLTFEIKGTNNQQTIQVGVKDQNQPDTGGETKKLLTLSENWQTVEIPLSFFRGVQWDKVYIPIELVFTGSQAQTVSLRNVQYRR